MKFEIKMGKDFDLKVGAHTVHVRFVPPSHKSIMHKEEAGKALNQLFSPQKNDEEDQIVGDFGCYNHQEYTIYIRNPDNFTIQLSTFFHEFLHVIEHFYSIELDHKELNLISEIFTQTILDNFSKSKIPQNVMSK